MRIVNKILLKILEKLKKNKFKKKVFEILKTNLEKLVENQRQIMYIVENIRLIKDYL